MSDETVPAFVIKCVLYAYASQCRKLPSNFGDYEHGFVEFHIDSTADGLAEKFNKEDFGIVLDKLSELIDSANVIISAPVCRYCSDETAGRLISLTSKWKKWDEFGRWGRVGIIVLNGALLLNDYRSAMIRADKLGQLDAYAQMRGTTAQLLRNTVMIDFGLDENGEKVYDLGGTTVKAYMESDLSIALFDVTNNKTVKSLPKKNADEKKYEKCSSDLKDLKKNIKKAISERAKRLRAEFLDDTATPVADWKNVYIDNAVMRKLAVTLVWRIKGKKTGFIPTENGGFVLSDGKGFALPETGSVCLAHPMDLSPAETEKWKKYLSENSIAQAFTQIYEPVYDLSDININGYEGIEIPIHILREMNKDGIGITEWHDDSCLGLTLNGNAVKGEIIPREDEPWTRGGPHSINGIPKDTFVMLNDCSVNKKAGKKKLNHDIFVLDKAFIEAAVRGGRIESLTAFAPCVTEKNIDFLINAAQEAEQTECLAWLMNYKNEHFGFSFPDLVLE